MKNVRIAVENISKCYRIGIKDEIYDSLGSSIFSFVKSPITNYRKYRSLYNFDDITSKDKFDSSDEISGIFWALKDVSFEVEEGKVIGIIGKNGAGKSTLLKILSRITEPTSGQATIYGRVSSLLEVGTGFHPELTGRENIYLNATVLGMKKKEVDKKLDEIINFSGIEKFLETPVKRYSSGMKVRLAFSVAAHLDPEVLIIDEVLAVGDAEFQKKCLSKMEDISHEGRTVLFVSHNMGAVTNLCSTCILLKNGSIAMQGEAGDIVQQYLSDSVSSVNNNDLLNIDNRKGSGTLRFCSITLQDKDGNQTLYPVSGEPLSIIFEFICKEELHKVKFLFTLYNERGTAVAHFHVDSTGQYFSLAKGKGRVTCHIPKLPLPLGRYRIAVSANDSTGNELDLISTACVFDVQTSSFFETTFVPKMKFSAALIEHTWRLN